MNLDDKNRQQRKPLREQSDKLSELKPKLVSFESTGIKSMNWQMRTVILNMKIKSYKQNWIVWQKILTPLHLELDLLGKCLGIPHQEGSHHRRGMYQYQPQGMKPEVGLHVCRDTRNP